MRPMSEPQMRSVLHRAGILLFAGIFLVELIRNWPLGQKNPRVTTPPSTFGDLFAITFVSLLIWFVVVGVFWVLMLLVAKFGPRR